MSDPVCPNCRSVDIEQDQREQGRNRCRQCGHAAPVRDFHTGVAPSYGRVPAATIRTPARERRRYTGRELENHVPAMRIWWQD